MANNVVSMAEFKDKKQQDAIQQAVDQSYSNVYDDQWVYLQQVIDEMLANPVVAIPSDEDK
jgi:hypothetical protein